MTGSYRTYYVNQKTGRDSNDGLTMDFRKVKLPHNTDNCPVCGKHPTITKLIDYEQAECDGVGL